MGNQGSRVDWSKLDCRKLKCDCRQKEGAFKTKLGGEGDHHKKEDEKNAPPDLQDDIPLMGITSDAGDDGDVSHNPDAWTPLNLDMNAMEMPPPDNGKKKSKKHKHDDDHDNANAHEQANDKHNHAEFEAFGSTSLFQNLDSDGFQIASPTDKPADSHTTTTTATSQIDVQPPPRHNKTHKHKKPPPGTKGKGTAAAVATVKKTKSSRGDGSGPGATNKKGNSGETDAGAAIHKKSGHSHKSGHSLEGQKPSAPGAEAPAEAPPKKRKKKKPKPTTDASEE